MGHYRVTVVAVGGHGCQREKGSGEAVVGCERPNCPDCITREYVRRLKRSNEQLLEAKLEHWPEDLGYPASSGVVDDLLTGYRTGAFPEREQRAREMVVPVSVAYEEAVGSVREVSISVSGGTTVRRIIEIVRQRDGQVAEGESYDVEYDDGFWRLGRPSCFTLGMEARHLPKGRPDAIAVHRNPARAIGALAQ